ncbi:MAG: carboxypeptidase-like regulatory domain-containing protein [Vicinamibacterales bacterium]|nr:carboxypeptidase-like regulatory domain-containing protein [Vicinamibacterales bacterium]
MRDKNFRLQVVCVLALIALASWPQFRPIKEQATVWRANPLEVRTQAAPLNRVGTRQDGSARSTFTLPDPNRPDQSSLLPELLNEVRRFEEKTELTRRRSEDENEGLEIIGRARTTMNEPVPYATLVLRNQLTGAVEGRARADESGRFVFKGLPVGKYVIELVDRDGRVASSAPAVPSGQTNASGNNRVQQAQATLFVNSTDNVTTVFGATTTSTAPETVRAAGTQDVPRVNDLDAAVSPRR